MSRATLRRAMGSLRTGDVPGALRRLEAVQVESADRVALGITWFLARRPNRAARELEAAARTTNPSVRVLAWRLHAELCGELGWNHESRASLEAWLAERPGAAPARRRLVDLLARSRAWEDADVALGAGTELPLRRAAVLRELGRSGEAAAVLRGLNRAGLDVASRRRLAEHLARCGALVDAIDALGDDEDARLLADRARILSFAGRYGDAIHAAEQALAAGASGLTRDRAEIAAAAALLLSQGPALSCEVPGDAAARDVVDRLTAVITRTPDLGEALIWRGHAYAVLGAHAEALADIDAGIPAIGGYDLGATLVRHLVEQRSSHRGFGGHSLDEVGEGLIRLGISRERLPTLTSMPALEATFGEALRALAGNRSGFGTHLGADSPEALGPGLSPRADARRALELIRVCCPETVLAHFDRVESLWPHSSMGVVHRAELLLWLGRHEEARAAFERSLVLNRHTRWGWIGQLGNEAFLGDPERALALGEEGVRVMGGYGPSHYVYRGEALRRLGRRAEAREDLAYAVRLNPSRMGARLTLALLCAELGDTDTLAEHMPSLRASCGAMLATALEELDLPPNVVWGPVDAEQLRPVLANAHKMMRGNRSSSCHTWFSGEGQLRINEARREDPFTARMNDRLDQAAAILATSGRRQTRATGSNPRG